MLKGFKILGGSQSNFGRLWNFWEAPNFFLLKFFFSSDSGFIPFINLTYQFSWLHKPPKYLETKTSYKKKWEINTIYYENSNIITILIHLFLFIFGLWLTKPISLHFGQAELGNFFFWMCLYESQSLWIFLWHTQHVLETVVRQKSLSNHIRTISHSHTFTCLAQNGVWFSERFRRDEKFEILGSKIGALDKVRQKSLSNPSRTISHSHTFTCLAQNGIWFSECFCRDEKFEILGSKIGALNSLKQ